MTTGEIIKTLKKLSINYVPNSRQAEAIMSACEMLELFPESTALIDMMSYAPSAWSPSENSSGSAAYAELMNTSISYWT